MCRSTRKQTALPPLPSFAPFGPQHAPVKALRQAPLQKLLPVWQHRLPRLQNRAVDGDVKAGQEVVELDGVLGVHVPAAQAPARRRLHYRLDHCQINAARQGRGQGMQEAKAHGLQRGIAAKRGSTAGNIAVVRIAAQRLGCVAIGSHSAVACGRNWREGGWGGCRFFFLLFSLSLHTHTRERFLLAKRQHTQESGTISRSFSCVRAYLPTSLSLAQCKPLGPTSPALFPL